MKIIYFILSLCSALHISPNNLPIRKQFDIFETSKDVRQRQTQRLLHFGIRFRVEYSESFKPESDATGVFWTASNRSQLQFIRGCAMVGQDKLLFY